MFDSALMARPKICRKNIATRDYRTRLRIAARRRLLSALDGGMWNHTQQTARIDGPSFEPECSLQF